MKLPWFRRPLAAQKKPPIRRVEARRDRCSLLKRYRYWVIRGYENGKCVYHCSHRELSVGVRDAQQDMTLHERYPKLCRRSRR